MYLGGNGFYWRAEPSHYLDPAWLTPTGTLDYERIRLELLRTQNVRVSPS